ncbi:MAG: hypothetical protein ACJ746_29075 [Bryobacteraceae bacterium]
MKNRYTIAAATIALCGVFALLGFTAGPTFRADYKFPGIALTDFKPLGAAEWKVQNGEIIGTPKDAAGGWVLLNGREFQETQIYAEVKCEGGCRAGILMRAERTPDGGMKGILMSVTENDLVPYVVRVDATGKEISRTALPPPAGRQGSNARSAAAADSGNPTARMAAQTAAMSGGRPINPGPPPPMSPELASQYPKESHLTERPNGAFLPEGIQRGGGNPD